MYLVNYHDTADSQRLYLDFNKVFLVYDKLHLFLNKEKVFTSFTVYLRFKRNIKRKR